MKVGKKIITAVLLLVFVFSFNGCVKTNVGKTLKKENVVTNTENNKDVEKNDNKEDDFTTTPSDIIKYYIPEMNATISVPKEYSVFGKDIDYTDEMCREAGVEPSNMVQYLSASFDQVHIIPRGDSFSNPSIEIRVKVKDNKYGNISLGSLSERGYKEYADAIASGFTDKYSTLEKNGMRFIVFDWDGPSGMSYRYATIINGDMIYVYAKVSGSEITTAQRKLLESIATSIEHR